MSKLSCLIFFWLIDHFLQSAISPRVAATLAVTSFTKYFFNKPASELTLAFHQLQVETARTRTTGILPKNTDISIA